VVAKPETELSSLGCTVVRDERPERHPAAGILAALRGAGGRAVVALACDMPFVPAELLRLLADHEAPVAVPLAHGRLQPLAARYEASAVPALEGSLRRGEPLREALASMEPAVIPESDVLRFGDVDRAFFNVNTPRDLEAAERLIHAETPPGAAAR
jgi:molybdopterin-guanine dinucleotide biosynthesis protein A